MRVPLEWLKDFVEVRETPERLADRFTMSGLEVEAIERTGSEAILELGITPNRGDCLSIVGVARELAAITGKRLRVPAVRSPRGTGKIARHARVVVRQPKRCPRYTARVVHGVTVGPSPHWMVKRLAACGIRSINNIVDATNYVMLERGQPLHAFDVRFVRGGRIEVRTAGETVSFRTLDGIDRHLEPDDLLICDGEGPVALAGIMGGENSEVRLSTTSVLLESACFEPIGVRRTARRLGLATDSSRRFERGVDPNGVAEGLGRLTELFVEIAGGKPTQDAIDKYPRRVRPKRIALAVDETNRLLGTELSAAAIRKLLARAQFGVAGRRRTTAKGRKRSRGAVASRLSVTVPTCRPDIERPVDLVEEVGRLHGYDAIAETMPQMCMASIRRPRGSAEALRARTALADAGFAETVLYSFTSEERLAPFAELDEHPIRISNPLSQEQGVMITTLLPGLLDVVRTNISRQQRDGRYFALQRVFHYDGRARRDEEPLVVAGALTGRRCPDSWDRATETIDFYDAKGAVETLFEALGLLGDAIVQRGEGPAFLHPGRFAYFLIGNERVGFVGELHPETAALWDLEQPVFLFELDFVRLAALAVARVPTYRELSRFPSVERDLALVLRERIPAVEVERAIQNSGVEIVEDVRIFDVYRGKGVPAGQKSIGVTLTFACSDRTLTDAEIDCGMERILTSVQRELGATLR